MSDNKETILCKRCGTEVSSNLATCPKCGEKLKEGHYGTTWLSIYTVLFGIRIFSLSLSFISIISTSIEYKLFGDALVLFIIIILAAEFVFELFTIIQFINRTELGYALNMVYVFLSTFLAAFNTSISKLLEQSMDSSQLVGVLIACAVFLAAWSYPNYIYFKHRKYLFTGKPNEKKKTVYDKASKNNNSVSHKSDKSNATATEAKANNTLEREARKGEEKNRSESDTIGDDSSEESVRIKNKKEGVADAQDSIPVNELRILKDLHESGVLTEEEFAEKKKQLLKI